MIRSRGTCATWHAAKRLTPNGGVIMPSARFTTIDQPEMHRVDAVGDRDRREDRREHDDRRRGLDEHADQEQEDVHREQEHRGVRDHRGDPGGRSRPARRRGVIRNENSPAAAITNMMIVDAITERRSTPIRSRQEMAR